MQFGKNIKLLCNSQFIGDAIQKKLIMNTATHSGGIARGKFNLFVYFYDSGVIIIIIILW